MGGRLVPAMDTGDPIAEHNALPEGAAQSAAAKQRSRKLPDVQRSARSLLV